ncbi:DNA polymerase subunit Cdc27 [Bombardia bombarda]|uniref:DNA polymerase delta subunit 3 n=1 Tax=Bombardia bombarda TaxID=252184 RepID=A0AA40CGQ5_9PEZI|nr:DNA polymerase subunit Cdc27 [Bombardia bombarda]
MDVCKKYLAENILSEDKVVTYRLLSRALHVHVNTAKQMLYDFYKSQNDRRPGAVHATYLVYGVQKGAGISRSWKSSADGDVEMASSLPEVDPIDDPVSTYTLSLVQEDRLEAALADFESVSSIHVYSVGPNPVKDFSLLADVAQEVFGLRNDDDPKTSATIRNRRVVRKERPADVAPPARQDLQKPALPKSAPAAAAAKVKEEIKPTKPLDSEKTAAPSSQAKNPTPALKRGGSSGIMHAFSKAKVKKAETSQPATLSGDEVQQALSDDGEDDDDEDLPLPKPRGIFGRKTKKEVDEELREMMEKDDDEDEKVDSAEEEAEEVEEPMEDAPEPEQPPVKEEPAEVVTTSGDGRRRGKRRIMRKKQIMDDQGYLVTIQEPGWESFSEDEAPPVAKAKPVVSAAASSAPAAKAKKSGPKGSQGSQGSQGSIMSFFSKK